MRAKDIKVETPLTHYMFAKASRAKIPLSGTFELSPVCNFTCKMCYVRKNQKEVDQNERSIMTLEQWLAIAKEAKEAGMLYLLLTGGEPLLWPDFWELYNALSELGFLISINTNGSLINEEVIEKFKIHPPTRINITLYGANNKTYERLCQVSEQFSKVDRAIQLLTESGLSVKLNGSLTPENVDDLEACVIYANERGLIYEPNTYMFPPIRRDKEMVGINTRFSPEESARYSMESYRYLYGEELYYEYLQRIVDGYVPPVGLDENCIDQQNGKIRCRAGKASFWITWDGWMTPCGMMPEPKVDIKQNQFTNAWEELVKLSEELKLSSACETCANHNICHSCAAMAIAETGRTSGIPVYLCKKVLEIKKIAVSELEKRNKNI